MMKALLVGLILLPAQITNQIHSLNQAHQDFITRPPIEYHAKPSKKPVTHKAVKRRITPPKVETKPVQAPVAPGVQAIKNIITKWAKYYGIDPGWPLRIAACESGYNLRAYNPSGATGLFQFMVATFNANYPRAGAGGDIYSAEDQSRTAIWMLAHGQAGQWVCQ